MCYLQAVGTKPVSRTTYTIGPPLRKRIPSVAVNATGPSPRLPGIRQCFRRLGPVWNPWFQRSSGIVVVVRILRAAPIRIHLEGCARLDMTIKVDNVSLLLVTDDALLDPCLER